jgi:hypothetical protein
LARIVYILARLSLATVLSSLPSIKEIVEPLVKLLHSLRHPALFPSALRFKFFYSVNKHELKEQHYFALLVSFS